MAEQLLSFAQLLPQVAAEAVKQGIDPILAQSILIAENTADGTYDPNRMIKSNMISPKGATGVMQVMPTTLQGLIRQGYAEASTDLTTITGGIHAGVAALKELMTRLGTTDPKLIAAGYNGSPQVAQAYAQQDPAFSQKYAETAQYIQKTDSARVSLGGTSGGGGISDPAGWTAAGMQNKILQYSNAGDTTIEALRQAVGASEKAGVQTGTAYEAKATSEGQRAQAAEISGQTQLSVLDRLRHSVGLVPEDPNSIYSTQIAAMNTAQREVDALTPQVAAAQNADILTNPLGWILGQAKMVTLAPRLENATARVNIAKNAIDTREGIAARQANLEAQTTQEALHLQRLGTTGVAAAEAQIAKLGAEQSTLALRTRIMSEELAVRGNLFNADATMFRLMQEKLGQQKLDKASAEEQETLDRLNHGLNLIGIPSIKNMTEYKTLSNNPQTREILSRVGFTGGTSTPGQSLVAIEQLGALPNIVQQDPVRGAFLQRYRDAVAGELQRGRPNPNIPGAFSEYKGNDLDRTEAAADNVAQGWTKEAKDSKDYRQLSKGNPYRMDAKAYASAPELKGNIFAEYVRTEKETPDEERLLAYATGKILADPKQTDAIIRQFNQFMNTGRQNQFKSFGMNSAGWDTKLQSYPMPLRKGSLAESLLGNKNWRETFDMLNEADIRWWLQKQAIAQMEEQKRVNDIPTLDVMGNPTGMAAP